MPTGSLFSGIFAQEVLGQPAALQDTLTALGRVESVQPVAARLSSGHLRRVVLTGMGASYYMLYPLLLALVEAGLVAQIFETSELIHYAPALIKPDTLFVAVSQSGRSAETLHLLAQVSRHALLIGITNTAESPLAEQADVTLVTSAGEERSVSCKTNVASLAALRLLGDALTGHNPDTSRAVLERVPEAMAGYLANGERHIAVLCDRLREMRHVMLVGRGPSLAAAGVGALTIKEAAHFPAEGMSSAAFRHGPIEIVSPEHFVVVFRGDERTAGLNARLAEDISAVGGQSALVREGPEASPFSLPTFDEAARPMLELLVPQMIAIALAQLGGREAGRFERAQKVTTIE